jgi:hypothetical protein
LQLCPHGHEILVCGQGYHQYKFDALVGDLLTTLNKYKVGECEQSML